MTPIKLTKLRSTAVIIQELCLHILKTYLLEHINTAPPDFFIDLFLVEASMYLISEGFSIFL